MRREEIDALITATEGRFCARLYKRSDGTVLTADCPKGMQDRLRDAAWKVRARVAALAASVAAAVLGLASLAERPEPGPGSLEPVTQLAPIDRGPQPVAQPIPPLPSEPRRGHGRTTLQTLDHRRAIPCIHGPHWPGADHPGHPGHGARRIQSAR